MRERIPRNNPAMIVVAWMVIAASLLGCSAFAEETETLKVVNWNVLYGFNHQKSVKQGANWIKKQAADVVALQELNGHNQARLEEVAAEWGHDHAAILKKGGFPVGLTSSQPIEGIGAESRGSTMVTFTARHMEFISLSSISGPENTRKQIGFSTRQCH